MISAGTAGVSPALLRATERSRLSKIRATETVAVPALIVALRFADGRDRNQTIRATASMIRFRSEDTS
jgi:hypothetical protein